VLEIAENARGAAGYLKPDFRCFAVYAAGLWLRRGHIIYSGVSAGSDVAHVTCDYLLAAALDVSRLTYRSAAACHRRRPPGHWHFSRGTSDIRLTCIRLCPQPFGLGVSAVMITLVWGCLSPLPVRDSCRVLRAGRAGHRGAQRPRSGAAGALDAAARERIMRGGGGREALVVVRDGWFSGSGLRPFCAG
jgi:hypothetical protein